MTAAASPPAPEVASSPARDVSVSERFGVLSKKSPGFVRVRFTKTAGVPKSQQAVLLWQGKKRKIVRKPGVVKLPNRRAWNVVALVGNTRDGLVVDPIPHRGNVFPKKSRKRVKKLKKGAATLTLDFSNRTSNPAAVVSSAAVNGAVAALPEEGTALPGYSLLSVPVRKAQDYEIGEPVVIGRDVKGFPNGFVGSVVRKEDGAIVLEAINPLSVFTDINYSQEVEGFVELPPIRQARTLTPRVGSEVECEAPTLRNLMSKVQPNLTPVFKNNGAKVESFGYSVGIEVSDLAKKELTFTGSASCTATLKFPGIKAPLGTQVNTSVSGYMSVSASGTVSFRGFEAAAKQGVVFKNGQSRETGSDPAVSRPVDWVGGSFEFTPLGVSGRVGIQWPADIQVAGFKAGANVEAWVEPSVDLVELASPSDLNDCAVQRQTQLNVTAGVTLSAELATGLFDVGREWDAFSFGKSFEPFWKKCLVAVRPQGGSANPVRIVRAAFEVGESFWLPLPITGGPFDLESDEPMPSPWFSYGGTRNEGLGVVVAHKNTFPNSTAHEDDWFLEKLLNESGGPPAGWRWNEGSRYTQLVGVKPASNYTVDVGVPGEDGKPVPGTVVRYIFSFK